MGLQELVGATAQVTVRQSRGNKKGNSWNRIGDQGRRENWRLGDRDKSMAGAAAIGKRWQEQGALERTSENQVDIKVRHSLPNRVVEVATRLAESRSAAPEAREPKSKGL